MIIVPSFPILQAQNEFSGICLLVRVWDCSFLDLFGRRQTLCLCLPGEWCHDSSYRLLWKHTIPLALPFFFSLSLSTMTFVLLAEVRKGSYLGFLLDWNVHCFGTDMSSLFLLLSWMGLYWMFSTTIDLQWDMDLASELTKSNWEKILGYQKCAFSVACSF